MGTTAQKLQAVLNSKTAIKEAIEAKGVSNVGNKLSDYATKIAEIPTGSSDIVFVIGLGASNDGGGLKLYIDGMREPYPGVWTNPTTIRFASDYWGSDTTCSTSLTIQYADGTTQTVRSDTTITPTQSLYVVDWSNASCLTGDTLILMSNGTSKRIDQLEVGDMVLSINPETNQYEPDEVTFTDSKDIKYGDEVDVWTFNDGTVLKTIHPHEFYNYDTKRFEYIADIPFYTAFFKIDGTTPRLIKHDVVKGKTRHFTLFTKTWNNYFANGLLTGNRHSIPLRKGSL